MLKLIFIFVHLNKCVSSVESDVKKITIQNLVQRINIFLKISNITFYLF